MQRKNACLRRKGVGQLWEVIKRILAAEVSGAGPGFAPGRLTGSGQSLFRLREASIRHLLKQICVKCYVTAALSVCRALG